MSMKERSKIISTEVLERSPGGYITKMKITEKASDGSGTFSHVYYLTYDEQKHKMDKFIEKTMKKLTKKKLR